MLARQIRIILGLGHPSGGETGGSFERERRKQCGDGGELRERRSCALEILDAGARANEQLESCGAIGAVLRRDSTQIPLRILGRRGHVAAIEGKIRTSKQSEPMRARLLEQ